jgi:hypothetical protein
MATRISQRDLEAISAYLDGQLSGKEQARLDARLQADTDLRLALEGMRRTRSMLRSMPRLRAPRNYVLTPQMLRRKSSPPAYPVLRLASALATFLFVLVLAGDLLSITAPQPAAVLLAEPTQEAVMQESAGETAEQERAAAPAGAEAPQEALKTLPSGTPEIGLMEAPPAAESEAQLAEPTPVPEAELFAAAPADQSEGDTAAADQPVAEPRETAPRPGFFNDTTFLILEIALALLALATGLAALYLRRGVGG